MGNFLGSRLYSLENVSQSNCKSISIFINTSTNIDFVKKVDFNELNIGIIQTKIVKNYVDFSKV